ncbi:ankyrin repeat-containing protein ITN1-like [Salvia miltiorrhiza]|uniref:ankyrin repeat-containing protein ITN1-like n=1 Tax=Salvia miltiorrhiza TaxID=226208 RepID=UPI0025AC1DF9|nr:ankyrin repeat-containing protein ITN1-like [Salvia miltiorrhiza]
MWNIKEKEVLNNRVRSMPPTVENVEHQRKRSTQQPCEEHAVPIYESFLAGCSRSKKQIAPPTVENVEHQTKVEKKKSKDYGSFPPNYTTCINIFKFATTVALTILGIGFLRIRKIHDKKVRHSHAMEIMNRMIESEPSYKYNNDGQRPIHHSEASTIPDSPPNDAETQTQESKDDHNIGDDKSKSSPLLVATEMGIPKIVKKLLDAVPTAIKDQNSEIVKKILDVVKDKYSKSLVKDTPLLVAAKMGIPEIVKKILEVVPIAIQDQDSEGKNVLMVAAENRQTSVFNFLIDEAKLPEYVFHHFDNQGNGILHLAAKLGEKQPWRIPGAALQMQWEIKWYKHVKRSVPALCYSQHNAKGETPRRIFTQTHENLVKSGNEWLVKTAESCSVVAALIATVAFATSATVPGGLDQVKGYPILIDRNAFDIFSIASLIALCLSITALVFLLAIITSRFEERDFKRDLPRKLLMGMSCLFSGIAAMLLSFCAGHTFILREKLRIVAVPIYTAAMIPVLLFAMGQLPLYFDLVWAAYVKVPLRSYKLYHQ